MKKFDPPWKWSVLDVPNSLAVTMIICFIASILLIIFLLAAIFVFVPQVFSYLAVLAIVSCFGYVIYAGFNPEKVKTGKRW